MFNCKLCEKEYVYTTYICSSCRRIKHCMNLYGSKRVVEILENVLIRNKDQQKYKIKSELTKEKNSIDLTASVMKK